MPSLNHRSARHSPHSDLPSSSRLAPIIKMTIPREEREKHYLINDPDGPLRCNLRSERVPAELCVGHPDTIKYTPQDRRTARVFVQRKDAA
jgi:hypothetical protein